MVRVEWELAPEATRQDSLVGRIFISDGSSAIAQDGVYVDSWLAALIRVVETSATGVVDIPEEAVPLRIEMKTDRQVGLGFRNQRIVAESFEELKTALADAVRRFLAAVADLPDEGFANPLSPTLANFITAQSATDR